MRNLGYPRPISMENFKTPNFELVADILYWFVLRYDPKADISDDIEEERDRVNFIKSISTLFQTKARIKLNPKKLYEATGFAVKEMLKIAQYLFKAMKTASVDEDELSKGLDFDISSKLHNLKAARNLASEITESGAKLYDFLGKENELREARDKAIEFLDSISHNLDSNTEQEYIEKCIRDLIGNQNQTMEQMQDMVKNLKQDEAELENKIKRRGTELERAEKRFQGIQSVRPEFMDEYERLEEDLSQMYLVYVEKFKNIDFLESDLSEYNKREEEAKMEAEKGRERIKKKFMQEEYNAINEDGEEDGGGMMQEMSQTRTGFNKKSKGDNFEAVGNFGGGEDDEEDDEDDEDEDDDDDIPDEDDDDDDASDHNF